MTGIVIAQTTIDDAQRAEALARGAVESRLAACAHIDPESGISDRKELRVLPEAGRAGLQAIAVEGPAEGTDVVVDGESLTERAVLDRGDVEAGKADGTRGACGQGIPGAAANACQTGRERVHGSVARIL